MKTWKYLLMTALLLPAALFAASVTGQVFTNGNATVTGAKVIVYTNVSLPASSKFDSAITNVSGTYTVTTPAGSGNVWFQATLTGYHPSASLQRQASATTVANINMFRDDSSSTVTGVVKRSSDSSPVIGATVTLTGGTLDSPRILTTDSTGTYKFTAVGTSTGSAYNIAVSSPGLSSNSVGSIGVGWNSTTTVAPIFLTRNIGVVAGTVRRADTTAKTIAGAKIVFYVNGLKVDSTVSDSVGNYHDSLSAATYTVQSSAYPSYRGNKGTRTRDTTVTVTFGATTNLVVYLVPSTGFISGYVNHVASTNPPVAAGGIDSAKVYLERRLSTQAGFNTWTLCDSTLTTLVSAGGYYEFPNLIPATNTNNLVPPTPGAGTSYNNPGGGYRLLVKAKGYVANYDTTLALIDGSNQRTITVLTVAFAANSQTTAAVINLAVVVPIYFPLNKSHQNMQASIIGDRLSMDLGLSNVSRTVEVFDLKGSLQHSVSVPAGESKAVLPATYAKGYLFQVK